MLEIRKIINLILLFFPKKLSNFLMFGIGCFVYKKSFSQFGEDLILIEYLKKKNINNGRYLDIGAFHPKWISNTFILHQNGFRGVVIDLSMDKLKYFKFLRGKKVKTINAAITNKKKNTLNYYSFERFFGFSEIDTLSKRTADKNKVIFGFDYVIKKIKNLHVDKLFASIGKIDVLNIDVEGLDLSIIRSSKLKLVDPEVILFEDNSAYFMTNKMMSFFNKRGYKILFQSGGTKCVAKI